MDDIKDKYDIFNYEIIKNNIVFNRPLFVKCNGDVGIIIVDGVPMSNNSAMTQGGFSNTAFTGTDLRQISADNIDNVEVVRGIPSAEYGDLTNGLVIVHSKMGVTPWQFKGKINPEMQNYSLGKGFSLDKAGILNFDFDYAKAWSDPPQKTRRYGRYSLNIGYAYNINRK